MAVKKRKSRWKRRLARAAAISFVVMILVLAALWMALPNILEPKLKELVVQKGGAALNAEIKLGEFSLRSLVPLTVSFRQVEISRPDGTLKAVFPQGSVEIDLPSLLTSFPTICFRTRLSLEDPSVRIVRASATPESQVEGESSRSSSFLKVIKWVRLDTGVDLQISRGQLDIQQRSFDQNQAREQPPENRVQLKGISVLFRQERIFRNQSPMFLSFQAMLEYRSPLVNLSVPISLDSKEIYTTPEQVDVKLINVNFGGLLAAAGGTTNFSPLEHNWVVKFQVPEINQIKVPPQFLPPGIWSGELSGKIHFAQKPQSPPYFAVQGLVRGLRGDTEFQSEVLQLKGAVAMDALLDAVYFQSWDIKELTSTLDLSGANLRYLDWFQKSNSDRLRIELAAKQMGKEFKIEKGELEFNRLLAHLHGSVQTEPGQSSSLELSIPPLNLEGFEAFFPFLKKQPLRGLLEVQAQVKGDLFNPAKIKLNVNPLRLKGLATTLNYTNQKKRIHVGGPLHVNAEAQLTAEGTHLQTAKASVAVEMAGMSIVNGDVFRKQRGDPLSIRLSANQSGDQIVVRQLNFLHPAGSFSGVGSIRQPQRPEFNFTVDVEDLKMAPLAQMIPQLTTFGLNMGSIKGKVNAQGIYDFAQGMSKSPVSLRGELKAQLGKIHIPAPDRNAKEKSTPGSTSSESAPAFLPNWPLFASSRLQLEGGVAQLSWGKEEMGRTRIDALYDKGLLTGQLSIRSFFGGPLQISKLEVPLLQANPRMRVKADIDKLRLDRAANWWNPEKYGNRVKGLLSLHGELESPRPGFGEWMNAIRAQGDLTINDFFVSTLDLDNKINSALSRLHQGNSRQIVDSKGVALSLRSKFKANNGQIGIKDFLLTSPENNEVALNGTSNFDLLGALDGELRLVHTSISGSLLAANSDSQGRLVIPVEMRGNLLNPTLSVAKATIEKMLLRTLEYEKSKAVKELNKTVQKEIKKNTEKMIDEGKQKVEQDINQRIKKLFQR